MKVPRSVLALLLGVSAFTQFTVSGGPPNRPAQGRYAKLPLTFEANVGQTNPGVKYESHGSGYTVFFTETDAILSLVAKSANSTPGRRADLRLHFAGGNPRARIEASD